MREDRAISDVVGYILVFSLVVSMVAIISVSGFGSLSDARNAEQANNAERAFDVLADNIADTYEAGAPSRATEISLNEARVHTTSSVIVNVTANDTSSPANFSVEKTTRPIVWEGNRDTTIVYSLGATLRADRDSGLVVHDPPFQLGTDRTVIPLVQLRNRQGQQLSGSTIRIRTEHVSSNVLLMEDSPRYDEVWLNITSPRAVIWQQHLGQYPDTTCSVTSGPDGLTSACKLENREELHVTLARISMELEG